MRSPADPRGPARLSAAGNQWRPRVAGYTRDRSELQDHARVLQPSKQRASAVWTRRSVKPSAQPTLVRTQHPPPENHQLLLGKLSRSPLQPISKQNGPQNRRVGAWVARPRGPFVANIQGTPGETGLETHLPMDHARSSRSTPDPESAAHMRDGSWSLTVPVILPETFNGGPGGTGSREEQPTAMNAHQSPTESRAHTPEANATVSLRGQSTGLVISYSAARSGGDVGATWPPGVAGIGDVAQRR